jgi:cell division protein FtsQ
MSEAPPPAGSPAQDTPVTGWGPVAASAWGPAAGLPPASASGGAAGARGRRPRRRRTRWRTAFFALAGVAVVAGAAWALLGDRLLVVRSVTVTGTHLLTPAQVTAAAAVPLGTPLLSVDTGAVARRVEAISKVASATVTEDWPDHLVIAVTERVPVMALRLAGGGYDLVDKTGVIVRLTSAKPPLPLLETALPGGALRGAPSVTAAAQVLAELQPWLAKQVTRVSAAPVPAGPEQVTLGLRDGTTVQWGSPDGAAQKNRELAILRGTRAHVIDVSAPGTVVTR